MRVTDFDRVVCITVDHRFPGWPLRARREVEAKGAECQIYLNGSARVAELGRDRYGRVNGPVPFGYPGSAGAYHLAMAFLDVVAAADRDGCETLLIVEDDLAFTADYEEVTAGIRMPHEWGIMYLGATHYPAATEDAGPHLLRVRGSYTTHAVGIHRRGFGAIRGLRVNEPIDVMLGRVHDAMPCYAAWPSVAVQLPHESSISHGHADYLSLFRSKGANWPESAWAPMPRIDAPAPPPRPAVAEAVRLARARAACVHGTKPAGCACQDTLICSIKGGARVTREECYRCLRGEA